MESLYKYHNACGKYFMPSMDKDIALKCVVLMLEVERESKQTTGQTYSVEALAAERCAAACRDPPQRPRCLAPKYQ
jgi:hypothetical protein